MLRIFRHYVPKSLVVLGGGEAALLYASVYFGAWLKWSEFSPSDKLLVGSLWPKALLYCIVMIVLMAGMGLYQRHLRDGPRGVLFRLSAAFVLGLVLLSVALWIWPQMRLGAGEMTVAVVVSALGVSAIRAAVHSYRDGDLFRRRVLVLGAGAVAAQAENLRRKTDRRDLELVGYLPVAGAPSVVPTSKLLTGYTDLRRLVEARRVEEIAVAVDDVPDAQLVNELLDCKMRGVRVIEMLTFLEEQTGKISLEAINPNRIIFAEGFIQAVVKGYIHRALDLVLGIVGLLVWWPMMVLTALAIVAESGLGAPILYRQRRVGRDGVTFEILKFRSMRPDAEAGGAIFAAVEDDRVTRVGRVIRKLRIDELPQLINVLKGEMSFVGPRPERPEFVAELAAAIPYYELRLRVNPGITGWAQISYPYGSSIADAKEKLQYDLYYMKNYSLFLDVMILLQTAQVVLWGKGAR